MIEIYKDGSSERNPGRGGWAAVLIENGKQRILSGGQSGTTNNRMEITAVIQGLEAVPLRSNITVYSDSEYVIKTMTHNWKRNANTDLWDQLDVAVATRNVEWRFVKAHAGNPLNELADQAAKEQAGLYK